MTPMRLNLPRVSVNSNIIVDNTDFRQIVLATLIIYYMPGARQGHIRHVNFVGHDI